MSDDSADLKHLILHEKLHRFFCRYFDATDFARGKRHAEFFAPDGEFNVYLNRTNTDGTPDIGAKGVAQIQKATEDALTHIEQTHHIMGSFWVAIEDGQTVVRARLRAYHKACGVHVGKDEESYSLFTAYMTDADGSWKIARFDYVVPLALGSLDAFPDVLQ
jgi:hypothetical protein